uniref:replication protein P n=5 Tax=Escherichia coli TaxID=562 RepID=UPI00201CD893
FFCSLLAPSDAILFQEGVSVKLRLPQVTNLYQNMRANALTDAELRRKAADELVHMTARINRGEALPEPVKQLPVMGGRPLNRAQALAKIAELKAKFGLKGASV